MNTSVFFNDTEGEQIQVFEPLTFEAVIENIDTETYGFEVEGVLSPVTGLALSGGLALLETEIVKSDDPTVAVGNEVPFAPSVVFNLAAQYQHAVYWQGQEGSLFGRVEYQFTGSRTVDPQNTFDLDSHDVVNLRAGLDTEHVSVYGFVTNLFEEEFAESAFLFGTSPAGDIVSVAVPGQPRRFGIGARVRF